MNLTLIACAAASLFASGGAIADNGVRGDTHSSSSSNAVQYAQYAPRGGPPAWDDHSSSVNERERQIKSRINRGREDGRITHREARGLLRQLASIEDKERAYRADGHLDRRENAELHRDLDRLALNVGVQLHDDDRRS